LKDNWDWPYILYVGRAWLQYTEKEVWSLTPRKFKSQLEVHQRIQQQMWGKQKQSTSSGMGYIDQIPGW